MNQNCYAHCYIIDWQSNSLHNNIFILTIKSVDFLTGGGNILNHLYLNDYALFDSKNSYMFLHEYLFACDISTVRTLALRCLVQVGLELAASAGVYEEQSFQNMC